ncbi:MAG: hypothetical protein V7704_05185 [Aurantimonas endophytica]|uniref:hypothetical protein n=1 Tax=Aurantimonas endophytica TaxID=1522175 RepID=UPI00300218E4
MVRILAPGKYKNLGNKSTLPRGDEITTRNPKDIEKILVGIIGNSPISLRNAIALNHSVFMDVKIIRHFYAHRNNDTIQKVKNAAPILNSGLVGHPDEYVDTILPGHTTTKYVEWSTGLQEFFLVA